MSSPRDRTDPDALLVRRTALRVGVWITVAASVLALGVLVVAFAYVLRRIPLSHLFDHTPHEETVDIGGLDLVLGGLLIGLLAIVLAGVLGMLATRRAVAPLVDALRRQRRFVADASHELRTPLTILDARLQELERATPADDPNHALVGELRGDSRRVIDVVNDLLDAVDVSSGDVASPAQVDAVVDAVVVAMRLLGEERGVRIVSEPGHPVFAAIAGTSLHRALLALVDNAVKHSPRGETVTVSFSSTRHRVAVSVTDRGPGIRGIAPDQVFDRFARSSLTVDGGGSASTGFGIGLSLVQDTVGRVGGDVEVTRTSAAGTTITMRLPRA